MELVFWLVAAMLIVSFGLVVIVGPPFVPTRIRHLEQAFDEVARLTPADVLLDLGSGNGVVLRIAARRGAKAVGYELNPFLVLWSQLLSRGQANVRTVTANFLTKAFPDDATIVYVFGDSRDIRRIERRVQAEATRLGRPLRLLSYGFKLPDTKPLASNGLHHLYRIEPLHRERA